MRLAPRRGWRPRAYAISVLFAAAVCAPLLREPPRDSFPLSTYPMFAAPRPRSSLDVVHAVGRDGTRRPLPPRLLASDEVLQAAALVRAAARQGPEAGAGLCARLAARVARDPQLAEVARIELVSARYDPLAYFTNGGRPQSRRVRAACAVERG